MTQPTVINDITDLYHILELQPHWREALRNQLLSAELLAMPEQLAQLTVKVDQLIETVAENSRQIAENSRQIAELRRLSADNSRQIERNSHLIEENSRGIAELRHLTADNSRQIEENSRLIAENSLLVAENSREIAELRRVTENQTYRMNRMESDSGVLKGMFAEAHPERTAREIADLLELTEVSITNREVLYRFAGQLGLPYNIRRSFTRADLVFQAKDSSGSLNWYAVEISWTTAPRDLERARRNAGLLREATGLPAYAVVCGHRYEEGMDWNGVHWLDLSDD